MKAQDPEVMEDQTTNPGEERPQRETTRTPKMAAYMEDEASKRLSILNRTYNQWKTHIKDCKARLKDDCTEIELGRMIDGIQTHEKRVIECFDKLKYCITPTTDTVRRVDACIAVTNDALKLINEMISGVENYTDIQFKKYLQNNGYATSIFTISDTDNESVRSENTIKSVASEKAVKAAVELADKRAELASLEVDIQYRNTENTGNEATKRDIVTAKRNVAAAEARLATFTEVANESRTHPVAYNNMTSKNEHSTGDLAKALADAVNLNRLPVPEPAIFSGDPLQFMEWRTSFRLLIEGKGITPDDKIFYLKKYVAGEAKRAIEGFFFSGSKSAYENAMTILEERFGHPFIVQRAFRNKLDNWPSIPARNPRMLRDYGDFLRACKDASDSYTNLEILSDCVENRKMVKKIPEWAAIKWNREVQSSIDKVGRYPNFDQFVNFVNKEARIVCNPMSSPYFLESKPHVDKHNVKALSTNAKETTNSNLNDMNKQKLCVYCKKKYHTIPECRKFIPLTIEQKRTFVKENSLCFGCLRGGHRNKECPEKLKCDRCNLRHPTCMHEERPERKNEKDDQENVKAASAFRVNRNDGQSTSMIVPVWLSSESAPDCEILTYALLDTQSDTSFIHEDTAASLQAQGNPIKLSLSTMASEKTVIQSKRVSGLIVRGFQSNEKLRINNAYTRGFIPVDRSHIPTRETASAWPHLKGIAEKLAPMQSCDLGLLLGYNCPEALAPRQTIQGEGTQPYAVLTSLGWSVVGYSDSAYNSSHNISATCNRVIVKELPPVSPKDAVKALEADFAHDSVNDVKVSQDDISFLSIMEENVRQRNDKHVELPLPFKKRPILPNNRHLALTRLSHLKRKLSRDEQYNERYKTFMKEMIERGDAELVPETTASDCQWYIPHHGVLHPKKPDKLRIVFDCSAKYNNTSLNHHLLKGPDLTNGLAGVLIRFRRYKVAIMCDIEKMFHQFYVREPDRDYLRFVWWENGDIKGKIIDLRMKKHLFGAASSPACANYGLKHLASSQTDKYPEASSFVQHDFYVDDGLTSVKNESTAIELVKDAQTICSNGGLQIPRCLISKKFDDDTVIELHHFSDASSYGYGQCSYIRLVNKDSVHCALLIGKARVAPLAVVTIPRLELTAAHLSVKMSQFLRRELNLPVNREYFWTDSRVVLGYIANEARRFHVFVANRVQMIRQSTEPSQWFYVQSSNNPADHASRRLNVTELQNSTWFTGPAFLWQTRIEYETVKPELQLGDPEVRTARSLHTETSEHINILELLERFSCWSKAISVVARLQRLANGVKGTHSPTVVERRKAELTIIKLVQRDSFPDAIGALDSSTSLPRSNSLYPLDPILKDGALHVGTRLRNANLPDKCIYPVILPKKGHVTKLIISYAHENVKHQGRGFTVNKLRSLGYGVVGGSRIVANFIRDCVVCRKLRRPTECQRMADLPSDRVEEYPPFTYCGMDCFGPFTVKQGRKEIKRYGLLFTCLCSRAVHIEMLDDMSTDEFINSLRCFLAIRGTVRHIRSDQGSNFIGAKNELSVKIDVPKVTSYLTEKQCDFILNAPSSSHTGGVWERQIRTIRNVLNSVLLLCPGRLDDASLRTLFYEVMAIVNSRPLTVSDINDPSAFEPLTPNHILTGKSDIPAPPPGVFVREDLRKRWRRVQYLLEQFWSRWQREYIAAISLRQKWHTARRNIRVNDIVLIKDSDLPRNQWPLAFVVEANPDDDGLVRRVKVKVGIRGTAPVTILERSVHKLVLLIEQQ